MKKVQKFLALALFLILISLSGCTKEKEVKMEKKGDIYYEIFVRSFNDSNGDGIGDLNGVTEKLDYLDDLGISGIWLMPIHPSPSYHKYDVMDYKAVDPSYGTIEDLKNLTSEAKKHDIKIMLDMVFNHSSSSHPWFKECSKALKEGKDSKYINYYNLVDKKQTGYAPIDGTSKYYEAWFSGAMPDLNLDNPDVVNELKEIIKFYIDLGVKGFRLDATYHYFAQNTAKNVSLLKELNDYALSLDPEFIMVGESWTTRSEYINYYEAGISSFDFDMANAAGQIVMQVRNEDGHRIANLLSEMNNKIKRINPKLVNSLFIDNHDMGRSRGYFLKEGQVETANALLILSPARPYIYYGNEIELRGSGIDPNKRLYFKWTEDEHCSYLEEADYDISNCPSLEEAKKDENSLYNYIKKLNKMRNKYSLFIDNDETRSLDLGKSLSAIEYIKGEDKILVIINLSDEEQEFKVDYNKISEVIGKVSLEGGTIGPRAVVILENE